MLVYNIAAKLHDNFGWNIKKNWYLQINFKLFKSNPLDQPSQKLKFHVNCQVPNTEMWRRKFTSWWFTEMTIPLKFLLTDTFIAFINESNSSISEIWESKNNTKSIIPLSKFGFKFLQSSDIPILTQN